MKTHLQFLLLPVFIFLFSIILFAQKIPSSINKEIETKDKNVDSVRIQSQYMGDAHNTDIYKSKKAPAKFTAKFVTTKGEFEVIAERNLSPLAVDRFYTLIRSNYFKNIPIYRVMKNFVAQFGTVNGHLDTLWSKEVILDEPVRRSNDTGTIAFARAGKNTRGTQLFINLKHNSKLDTVSYGETLGFPPFAYVSKGMDVVYKFYDGYGDEPRLKLDDVPDDATDFLKKNYPNIDYILDAIVISVQE